MTTTHNYKRTPSPKDSANHNPSYTLSSELEEHQGCVEYESSAAVCSTSASSNQSRAKQTRAKKSYTKKNRARRAQAQSTPNMQDRPPLKRTNLKVHEKREIIGITSFFNSAFYKIIGPIFNVARQTVHGLCKQAMKEKVLKVPQADNWTSRVRTSQSESTMDTEAETEADPESKKGPLDGMTMAFEAICKLLNRPIGQIPDMMLDWGAFTNELKKYLITLKLQIEMGGKTRPEGSLFENFSLRWILSRFVPKSLFCCEIADTCSAVASDPLQPRGQIESPISTLLLCNRDFSMAFVGFVHVPDISDFDPVQCERKIIFNDPQNFEMFTLSNFLIQLDELNEEKILILIDEVQWNLLRASSTAPLPDTRSVYVMVVPNRLRSILPFNCLAERFKDFICRNDDPKYVADTLAKFLCQTNTFSEIQGRFSTFLDNVGMCA